MNIPANCQLIFFGFDEFCSIAALKDMPDKMVLFVKIHGISGIQAFHDMFCMMIDGFELEMYGFIMRQYA